MADPAILIVVAIRDPAIRSALAAHLSSEGHDLLTADGIGNGLLSSPMIRQPAILVIHEALIPGEPRRWIEAQRRLDAWLHLVVLSAAGPGPGNRGRWLIRASNGNAERALGALLADRATDVSRDR